MAQRRMVAMRAWIWSAVACGSGGPPQVWRSSAWMTPCGWPVRWLQAPTRPLSSLRRPASCWRLTGGAAGAGGAGCGARPGPAAGAGGPGRAEETPPPGGAGRGGGAELAAVVQDPVEVNGRVEGLEGRLVELV